MTLVGRRTRNHLRLSKVVGHVQPERWRWNGRCGRSRIRTVYRQTFVKNVYNLPTVRRVVSWRSAAVCVCVCVCGIPDLPGGVRNRESGECAASRPVASGAVGRRRAVFCLAVLCDDGQRLLERVWRPADDRCAAVHVRRRGALFVCILTTESSRERRGKCVCSTHAVH